VIAEVAEFGCSSMSSIKINELELLAWIYEKNFGKEREQLLE
jgi:hypothetical protein